MNVIVIYYKVLYPLLVPVYVDQGRHEDALRTVSVLAYPYLTPHLLLRYSRIDIAGTSLQSKHDCTLFSPFVYDSRSRSKRSIKWISSVLSPSSAKPSPASLSINYIITKDLVFNSILFRSS